MRRPAMSTGAWIAVGLVAAAIIAPTAVYSAATSTVAIGNTSNGNTANVNNVRQLMTATVAPSSVLRLGTVSPGGSCTNVYAPPAGKALMVTQATYDIGSGTEGTDAWAGLAEQGCNGDYDLAETVKAHETQTRTFPIGLPLKSLAIRTGPYEAIVFVTGYLVPSAGLQTASVHGAAVTRVLRSHTK